MRKLIVPAFISLDGVIQGPGGPSEDTSGDFSLGGWVVPFADEASEPMGGIFTDPYELVLGRRTYDIFAGYWPNVPEDAPHRAFADEFNRAAKHVATHDPKSLAWQNSRALGPDVIGALRALKDGNGPKLLTQGSSELVRQLLAADIVDELVLLIYPILLGRGKRLYDDGVRPASFELASSKQTSTGVQVNRYVRIGDVKVGSFALDA